MKLRVFVVTIMSRGSRGLSIYYKSRLTLKSSIGSTVRACAKNTDDRMIAAPMTTNSTPAASLDLIAASRLGLDPSINRFHSPLVYHENYSFADWPENHTFPVSPSRRHTGSPAVYIVTNSLTQYAY